MQGVRGDFVCRVFGTSFSALAEHLCGPVHRHKPACRHVCRRSGGMCVDQGASMCVGVWAGMCVDKCAGTCAGIRAGMCVDKSASMWVRYLCRHVRNYMCRHANVCHARSRDDRATICNSTLRAANYKFFHAHAIYVFFLFGFQVQWSFVPAVRSSSVARYKCCRRQSEASF